MVIWNWKNMLIRLHFIYLTPTAHLVDQNFLVIRKTKLQLLAWMTSLSVHFVKEVGINQFNWNCQRQRKKCYVLTIGNIYTRLPIYKIYFHKYETNIKVKTSNTNCCIHFWLWLGIWERPAETGRRARAVPFSRKRRSV